MDKHVTLGMLVKMTEIETYLVSYWAFLLVFSAGCTFGYVIANNIRVTEIALELWQDGARDCVPFLTPPWNGPLKFCSILLAFWITYAESKSLGTETWLYGVTCFLIGFATIYGWVGDRSKTNRWLPGMHSRLVLRYGQLKTMGERQKADALKVLEAKFVARYPKYRSYSLDKNASGPFEG